MLVKFKNPPINEVVISTYFDSPIIDLQSQHVGAFWSEIIDRFPEVSQQRPVGEIHITSGEPFPMPRYWLIAEDDATLIQIQKNAFMFNWRRRGDEYPHFEYLKPEFDQHFDKFSEFVKCRTNKKIKIGACELAYINMVYPGEYWKGPQDTANVIPTFSTLDLGGGIKQPQEYDCSYAHAVEDDLHLRVLIRTARSNNDEQPVLVFEIKAAGRFDRAAKPIADEWFDRAHKLIIDTFVKMTDTAIQQKYWGRQE